MGTQSGSTMQTIHFLCRTASLRNLTMIFFLVGLPESLESNISEQFRFETLNATDRGETQNITAVNKYSLQFSMIFMFGIVSLLGSLIGSLRIVKWLVPVTAIAQLLPLSLLWSPTLWTVGIVGSFSPLGIVLYVPLSVLVSIVAPP